MEENESLAPMSSLSLDVKVPCDARYLPILWNLAQKTVEYIGYHELLREEVVRTIDYALDSVVETDGTVYTDIEFRLATTENDMLARIRYLGAPERGEGPTAIEQLLSRPDGDEVPLKRLRRTIEDGGAGP